MNWKQNCFLHVEYIEIMKQITFFIDFLILHRIKRIDILTLTW